MVRATVAVIVVSAKALGGFSAERLRHGHTEGQARQLGVPIMPVGDGETKAET
jgi:hypothetical protein